MTRRHQPSPTDLPAAGAINSRRRHVTWSGVVQPRFCSSAPLRSAPVGAAPLFFLSARRRLCSRGATTAVPWNCDLRRPNGAVEARSAGKWQRRPAQASHICAVQAPSAGPRSPEGANGGHCELMHEAMLHQWCTVFHVVRHASSQLRILRDLGDLATRRCRGRCNWVFFCDRTLTVINN